MAGSAALLHSFSAVMGAPPLIYQHNYLQTSADISSIPSGTSFKLNEEL